MDSSQTNRHTYVHELQDLEHDLLEMAGLAETMVNHSVEALCQLDHDLALEVMRMDDLVDVRDLDIESRCLKLLAFQQPMAGDFRVLGTAIKMIVDIERVGDLAVDIAKCGMKIDAEMGSADVVDIRKMANVARTMFRDSIEAFVKRDMEIVQRVVALEDVVDGLYRDLRGQIHDHMRHHPAEVVSDSWLMLAVHHIERIADHAVNIAERVNFVVTGKLEQLAKSHQSETSSKPPTG